MLSRIRARKGRIMSAIKRADAEATPIKRPQRDQKGDNKASGYQRLHRSRARTGRRRATIKRANAEAKQIKSYRRIRRATIMRADERGYTDQGPVQG